MATIALHTSDDSVASESPWPQRRLRRRQAASKYADLTARVSSLGDIGSDIDEVLRTLQERLRQLEKIYILVDWQKLMCAVDDQFTSCPGAQVYDMSTPKSTPRTNHSMHTSQSCGSTACPFSAGELFPSISAPPGLVEENKQNEVLSLSGDWRSIPATAWSKIYHAFPKYSYESNEHSRNCIDVVGVEHDKIEQPQSTDNAEVVVKVPAALSGEIDKFIAIVSRNIQTIPAGSVRSELIEHSVQLKQAARKQIAGPPATVRSLLSNHCNELMDSRDCFVGKFLKALSGLT